MSKAAFFDKVASGYDREFTFTPLGNKMRERVRSLVNPQLTEKIPLKVLEINCGTGEDSIWLAKMGHQVLATDISNEMIAVGNHKKSIEPFPENQLRFMQAGFDDLNGISSNGKFNFVFSNFGGMNCTDPRGIKRLSDSLANAVYPDGKIFLVIMPRFCIWETFYFLLKLRFKKAFRRLSKMPVSANLGNSSQPTWYYSPRTIKKIFSIHFKFEKKIPIGICLPPSYLNLFFAYRPGLLNFFGRMENFFGKFSFLAGLSDHYLIQLTRKS